MYCEDETSRSRDGSIEWPLSGIRSSNPLLSGLGSVIIEGDCDDERDESEEINI